MKKVGTMAQPVERLLECDRFAVERIQFTLTDGSVHQRDVVRHPGSVVILPLLADGQVCLIRNYRASVGKTLIELPAGTCEPHESPRDTAARELVEETGFVAGLLRQVAEFYAAPGILDEKMVLYLATELEQVHPRREAGEQIENLVVSLEEARDLVEQGVICDAKTIVGLWGPWLRRPQG